jgi:uncharacterized membrane protein YfcA
VSTGIGAFILAAVLATATLSGIFGMAGGLILMGVLTAVMPATAALAIHGLVQLASNASRIVLHLKHVSWRVVGFYGIGALATMGAFTVIAYTPSKSVVYLALGLLPILVWLPERYIPLDAARPSHAVLAGILSTALALTSGVSGPLADVFLVRSVLTRHQVLSTKAALQMFSHISKVMFYGGAILMAGGGGFAPPWLLVGSCLLAVAGVSLGARVLDKLSDQGFQSWRRWIFTAIAAVYLVQAAFLFARGQ